MKHLHVHTALTLTCCKGTLCYANKTRKIFIYLLTQPPWHLLILACHWHSAPHPPTLTNHYWYQLMVLWRTGQENKGFKLLTSLHYTSKFVICRSHHYHHHHHHHHHQHQHFYHHSHYHHHHCHHHHHHQHHHQQHPHNTSRLCMSMMIQHSAKQCPTSVYI